MKGALFPLRNFTFRRAPQRFTVNRDLAFFCTVNREFTIFLTVIRESDMVPWPWFFEYCYRESWFFVYFYRDSWFFLSDVTVIWHLYSRHPWKSDFCCGINFPYKYKTHHTPRHEDWFKPGQLKTRSVYYYADWATASLLCPFNSAPLSCVKKWLVSEAKNPGPTNYRNEPKWTEMNQSEH